MVGGAWVRWGVIGLAASLLGCSDERPEWEPVVVWETDLASGEGKTILPKDIVATPDGGVLVMGGTTGSKVLKVSPQGAPLWSFAVGGGGAVVGTDRDGNIGLCASFVGSVDLAGHHFEAKSPTDGARLVAKLSSDATTILFDHVSFDGAGCSAAAFAPDGALWIAGPNPDGNGLDHDRFYPGHNVDYVAKFSALGEPELLLDTDDVESSYGPDLAVSLDGDLAVAAGSFVQRIDASGQVVYRHVREVEKFWFDMAHVAFANNDDLLVAGNAAVKGGSEYAIVVLRVAPDGSVDSKSWRGGFEPKLAVTPTGRAIIVGRPILDGSGFVELENSRRHRTDVTLAAVTVDADGDLVGVARKGYLVKYVGPQ